MIPYKIFLVKERKMYKCVVDNQLDKHLFELFREDMNLSGEINEQEETMNSQRQIQIVDDNIQKLKKRKIDITNEISTLGTAAESSSTVSFLQ